MNDEANQENMCNVKVDEHHWRCPIKPPEGENYCFWHKKEVGKRPTLRQIEDLTQGKKMYNIYLEGAYLEKQKLSNIFLINADLTKAHLTRAILKGAKLEGAKLKKAVLDRADLTGAYMFKAELKEASLKEVHLRGANLSGVEFLAADLSNSDLHEVDLKDVNLQEANLSGAKIGGADLREVDKLRGANFYGTFFDFRTNLERTDFTGANLFNAYFDEAKSFRNALVLEKTGKEINEIAGDVFAGFFIRALDMSCRFSKRIKKFSVTYPILRVLSFLYGTLRKTLGISLPLQISLLDVKAITDVSPTVAHELQGNGFIRYVGVDTQVIFFDRFSGCIIKNPENKRVDKNDLVPVSQLKNLVLKGGVVNSKFLFSKSNRKLLYECSYMVYNQLYRFYKANDKSEKADDAYYRSREALRKSLIEKGGRDWLRSWTFDFLVLRVLTGYGKNVLRPALISVITIISFALLFKVFNGIVKNVSGKVVPSWWDYLYFSVTTFTGLGFSNIQPNLGVGPLPQFLVGIESALGVLMMALIIFTVTYQVSR